MTDPLPADVRRDCEDAAESMTPALRDFARGMLAKYPKHAPAWQPGDVVIAIDAEEIYGRGQSPNWLSLSRWTLPAIPDGAIPANADLIARGGRRVHPARFHDYAQRLNTISWIVNDANNWTEQTKAEVEAQLQEIAAGIDPDA